MRLEGIEQGLENSVNESYSERGFPVMAGVFADKGGPTGLCLVLTGVIIYAWYRQKKKGKN